MRRNDYHWSRNFISRKKVLFLWTLQLAKYHELRAEVELRSTEIREKQHALDVIERSARDQLNAESQQLQQLCAELTHQQTLTTRNEQRLLEVHRKIRFVSCRGSTKNLVLLFAASEKVSVEDGIFFVFIFLNGCRSSICPSVCLSVVVCHGCIVAKRCEIGPLSCCWSLTISCILAFKWHKIIHLRWPWRVLTHYGMPSVQYCD